MKKIIYLLLFATPVFILIFCTASTTSKEHKTSHDSTLVLKDGFAVIELFTSQGCSSCPPADRLLGTYAAKENVYALSFHVDYWNKLGWKDPFSDAAFTKRQSGYADKFGSSVYTPQAVVNGQTEMVGSDESNLSTSVDKFLSEEPAAQINISDVKTGNKEVSFNYELKGKIDKAVLNVALIQNEITTSVKRGENGGLDLTNYNVVRNFKTIDLNDKKTNNVSFQLPEDFKKEDYKIVAFVQVKKSYTIVAATKCSL